MLSLLLVSAAGCGTDDDCNLNGVCEAGKCACAAAWAGDTCGVLNLHAARLPPNAGYNEANFSSWGGSIVRDGDKWHMFVSRMAGHCGLSSWQQNSEMSQKPTICCTLATFRRCQDHQNLDILHPKIDDFRTMAPRWQ